MERFQRYLKPLLAVSIAVAVLLGGTAMAQARKITDLNNRLNAYSVRAVYEGAELMRGVESNLRKLTASASGAQLQQCLSEISRQAQGAESAVTSLPLSGEGVQAATKVINQMSDYASSLSNRLARGGAITDDDAGNIDRLIAAAASVNAGLERMIEGVEAGQGLAADSLQIAEIGGGTTDEGAEYPTLIYDGPFSDASDRATFKALDSADVTQEQAAQKLREYLGADRVDEIRPEGESDIPVHAYEFSIRSGDVEMSAAVTRNGGEVLYILPETMIGQSAVNVQQCLSNASQFLSRNGYGEMLISYYYSSQNVLTINFAAVQDEVLLYPDLVKVQVSMQDGSVIGVECVNYLKNHVKRAFGEVQISGEEAMQRVNAGLQTQFVRLALIPLNAREVLTYEIAARDSSGNQYLIYIDAVNGQEQQIYQLLSDENGTLAE